MDHRELGGGSLLVSDFGGVNDRIAAADSRVKGVDFECESRQAKTTRDAESAFRVRSRQNFWFSDILISDREEAVTLVWRKPKIVEIAVGLEINSYACAQV